MNDEVINDLKQFIAATVMQQASDIRSDIENLDKKLSTQINDLSASVAEAIESNGEETDAQLKSHDQRISLLEQKAA